jgi:RNA polymerase sigma-70 factor (ECF subfamily)
LLADVEELSYREIAEVVGCPIGTVMSRLHRARRQLQSSLQEHAAQLGIIQEEEDAEEPISLGAFRSRKAVKS